MRVVASAPGKTILMGEHAAVYQRPALVAAVSRRLRVEIETAPGRDVELDLPIVDVAETVSWDQIRAYARAARRAWHAYDERPGAETFARVRGDDPAHLVKVALGETADFLGEDGGPGIAVRVTSEIPVGAGFGSSAAAAVALVAAYGALRGVRIGDDELHRLSLEVERRQHGSPSGVDNATVLHGGLVWARREPAGGLAVEPLAARSPLLGRIRIFHTGTPAESTGAVVAAVRDLRAADPQGFERRLERMAAATRALRRELERAGSDAGRIVELIRGFEAGLEEIGVVPPAVRALIRRVERRGGAAKVSGAGALTGERAGALLVFHPEPGTVDRWDFLDPRMRLDLRLGAGGLRLDDAVPLE